MSKSPTIAERRRFGALQEMGCIACRIDGRPGEPPDIHHLVEGGRRIGHAFSLPLCPWHHRGVSGMGESLATQLYGPSLARSKRDFVARYGSERELLRMVDDLIP